MKACTGTFRALILGSQGQSPRTVLVYPAFSVFSFKEIGALPNPPLVFAEAKPTPMVAKLDDLSIEALM